MVQRSSQRTLSFLRNCTAKFVVNYVQFGPYLMQETRSTPVFNRMRLDLKLLCTQKLGQNSQLSHYDALWFCLAY